MKRAAIIVVVCAVIFFAVKNILLFPKARPPMQNAASSTPVVLPPKPEPVVTSLPPLTNLTMRAQRLAVQPAHAEPRTEPIEAGSTAQQPQPSRSGKPPRQDPIARMALSLVGVDGAAEEYWLMAINDPSLSESEREDLIEDLNEEGFEDPKNPTVDELPLILNRLQIIEEYAPFAMDDVNARSFAEAYKDLVNMYVRLTGQEPQ